MEKYMKIFWGGAPAPPQTPICVGGAPTPDTAPKCRHPATQFVSWYCWDYQYSGFTTLYFEGFCYYRTAVSMSPYCILTFGNPEHQHLQNFIFSCMLEQLRNFTFIIGHMSGCPWHRRQAHHTRQLCWLLLLLRFVFPSQASRLKILSLSKHMRAHRNDVIQPSHPLECTHVFSYI